MDLKNKPTVVITGASRGIGLGLTQAYLREGYRVVANARRMSLEESDDLAIIEGDVAEPGTGEKLAQVAVERFGRLDVLINNAGIFVPKPFVDYSREDFERVVGTNLAGFFYVTQPALRQMLKQRSGSEPHSSRSTNSEGPSSDLPPRGSMRWTNSGPWIRDGRSCGTASNRSGSA